MKVFFELPLLKKPCFLAIGNFDGVHLGHQKIIQVLKKRSWYFGLPSAILTFHPHPEVFFKQNTRMITTLSQRLEVFQGFGLDMVFIMEFNEKVANMEPEDFVKEHLVGLLKAKEIFVGEGFQFGRKRRGNIDLLLEIGKEKGFKVYEVKKRRDKEGQIISSTFVRKLLAEGRVKEAGELLGRPYEIKGILISGLGIARRLGFPTLNLKPFNEILPKGIFSGYVRIRSKYLPAAIYIGTRPTHGGGALTVEAHILEGKVKAEIGEEVRLVLAEKIRDEKKFCSEKELVAQIFDDLKKIKEVLKNRLNW